MVITTPGAGNAVIEDSSATTILGSGTNVGGNLTIENIATNGIIRDSGAASALTVIGDLSLLAPTAGTGFVQLTGNSDSFGGLAITDGTGLTNVLDSSSLILLTASPTLVFPAPATTIAGVSVHLGGNAAITSSGAITTSGTGTMTFGGSLTLGASKSIVSLE